MTTVSVMPLAVNSYERQDVFNALWDEVGRISCATLRELVNGALDDEVSHRLGRGAYEPRDRSGDVTVAWECHRCGESNASQLKRNGHYRRQLQTTLGTIKDIRVPMVRCVRCGAAANVEFAALRKHKQMWIDVDLGVLFAYGAEEGFRHIAEDVGQQLGWPLSASTVQARVHEFVSALKRWRQKPIVDPPDVVMLDGIWFTVVRPTEEYTTDRNGRRRPVVERVKRVAIIALGLWSESGRKDILDFELADSEDERSCVRLLERLHLRGATDGKVKLLVSDGAGGICAAIETVYPTVPRQRCVFHKLKNAGDSLRDKSHRKAALRAASAIYKATDTREAHQRLQQFVKDWQEAEPEAVASLLTDFDASIAYMNVPNLKGARRYRTTNAIEGGVMRPLRRTIRRATAFRSDRGAEVALFLAIAHLNATQRNTPWAIAAPRLLEKLDEP